MSFLSFLLGLSFSVISCKNRQGKPVQWFVIIKPPSSAKNAQARTVDDSYFYWDEQTSNLMVNKSLKSTNNNPLYNTLLPLYKKHANVNFIFANSLPPGGDKLEDSGVSNFVTMWDNSSGLYLIHSVPSFPRNPTNTEYSDNEFHLDDGQTFMCWSVTPPILDIILHTHTLSRPRVYLYDYSPYMEETMPSLPLIIQSKWFLESNATMVPFILPNDLWAFYAKSPHWHKDLYHDLMAPMLDQDLYVMSRPSDTPISVQHCYNTYTAVNIREMNLSGYHWPFTMDNSKWAVGYDAFCVGDIIREEGHLYVGGSALCRVDVNLARQIRKSIFRYQRC